MKHISLILLFLCLCISCAAAEDVAARIMVVSDLHYLAPSLYEGSDLFVRAISRGDGKATMYSGELLTALLAEVRHQKPDALVISGDLTFNGEKQSHAELAEALHALVDEGIPVAVIPGNHDINNPIAVRYLPNGYEFIANTTPEDFRLIWQDMLAQDLTGQGFSGVLRVNDRLWIVLGDYCVYEDGTAAYGLASPQHTEWMTRVTVAAREAGAELISVSHQALLAHTTFSADSYRVHDSEGILTLLNEAGCRLNLSGHMHLQHILRDERITDIATGAWSVSPHRYGIITVSEGGILAYDACTLCSNHALNGLLTETRSFFRQVTEDKLVDSLSSLGLAETEINEMLSYAVDVNEAYFAGTISVQPELVSHPGRQLWETSGAALGFGAYLSTIPVENSEDACHWQSN